MLRALLLLPFLASPLLADEVRLADGRVYEGKASAKGKRTRIDCAKRWVDVPTAWVKAPAAKPEAALPDPKPWRARWERAKAAAAALGDAALVKRAEVELAGTDASTCAALAGLFAAGAGAPLPGDAAGLQAELARARLGRRYGAWLEAKVLLALDPGVIERAEGLIGELLAARAGKAPLAKLLDRVTALRLDYAVWEALVRGGAGASWDAPGEAPRKAIPLTLPGGKASRYLLQVPPALRPGRPLPLIVALHGQNDPLGVMMRCWGRFAREQGCLLVSVEYAVTGAEGYHHSYLEQSTVLSAIRDVDRRYAVDMDRVFVTGHSMGGHAAWDAAFSHPDRFAGVIPLISSHFAFDQHYRRNARRVPVYCIQGEKDVWTERCREQTEDMLKQGADVTYVEYIGRGHEGFYEELPWVAPWIKAREREAYPQRFELVAGRPTDMRRFWVAVDALKIRLFELAPTSKVSKKSVATVAARVERKNTLRVDCKQAKAVTVFLSDRLLDLDEPIRIRVNKKMRFKGHVNRSPVFMLQDFLERGDRQMLYAASVEITGL